MELKDFISCALVDICEGIAIAKSQIKNGAIAPHKITTPQGVETNVYGVENIHFEICVTTEIADKSQIDGQGKLNVLNVVSASIGKNTGSSASNINVNKVSFNVPYVPAAVLIK